MSLVDFLATPLGGTLSRAEAQTVWSLLDSWLSRQLDEAKRLPPIIVMLTVGLLGMVNPRCLLDPEVWVGVAVFGGLPAAILWGLEKLKADFKRTPILSFSALVFAVMMTATWPTKVFYGVSSIGLLLVLRTVGLDLLRMSLAVVLKAECLIGKLSLPVSRPGADHRPKPESCAASEHRSGAQRGLIRYVEGGNEDDDAEEHYVETLNRDGPQPAGAKVGWRETFFRHVYAAGAAWEVRL